MKRSLLVGLIGSIALSLFGSACSDGEPDTSGVGGGGGEGAMGGEPGTGGMPSCASSQDACNGLCTNLDSDPENCGACDKACGANEGCVQGKCERYGCATGQVECSGSCTSLQTDPAHCGTCERACASGELCSSGACVLSCPGGTVACNGACIDPMKDREHCGATNCDASGQGGAGGSSSGDVCSVQELCVDGLCQVTCAEDELVCGNRCADPMTDAKFCGATDCSVLESSGEACESGQACVDGACEVSCPGAQVACGGECVNPATDAKYCGATTCVDDATNGEECDTDAGEVCADGTCDTSCPPDQLACDGTCVTPATDLKYCGATTCVDDATNGEECNTTAGEVCSSGVCKTSCPPGQVVCGGKCVKPASDNEFCGATDCAAGDATNGDVCDVPEGEVCVGGACVTTCPTGQLLCGAECISPDTNRDYCGALLNSDCLGSNAGVDCASGQVCSAKVCTTSCGAGQADCGGTCVDPLTDRAHCGADINTCLGGSVCGDGKVCGNGVCEATCPIDTLECSGSCVNPLTSNALCGASDCAGTGGETCGSRQACLNGSCVAVVQWQTGQQIDSGAPAADTEQAMATDSAGNATLVFRQRADQNDSNSLRLWGSYYSAASGTWTAPVQIDSRPQKVRSLQVDMNDAGVAVAVWIADTVPGSQSTVVAARFSGGTWSAPVDVDGNLIEFPSVYVDNLGQGAIVYAKDMDNVATSVRNSQVYGAVLTASTTLAGPVALSDFIGASGYNGANPRISGNSAGQGMVVYWQTLSGVERNVYGLGYASTTGFAAASSKVPLGVALTSTNRPGAPDVAVDAAGKAYAVWPQTNALYSPATTPAYYPTLSNIHASVFDGTSWGSPVAVTSFGSTVAIEPKVSTNLGTVGLTYQVYDAAVAIPPVNFEIYGHRYAGGTWIDQHLLDAAAQSSPQPLPKVAVGGTGDIHFVWATGAWASSSRFTSSGGWTSPQNLASGGEGTGAVQWPILAATPTVAMFASWVQNVPGQSAGNHVFVSRYE